MNIHLEKNVLLSPHTTMAVGGPADYFVEVSSDSEIAEAVQFASEHSLPVTVLGGGSNLVVSDKGVRGLVIKVGLKGLSVTKETETEVWFRVGAGQPWDEIVDYAVHQGWWGMENLSHIPGLTGAVAVQNVGAYGQEAREIIDTVETVRIEDGSKKTFTNLDCGFDYRSSIFNTTNKGQYIITAITYKLSKIPKPNLAYGDVINYFKERNLTETTIAQIREAIIYIRDQKFPYPRQAKNGSCGSFFKSPTISENSYDTLVREVKDNFGLAASEKLAQIKDRLVVAQGVKVPYGYLIELCGLKGKSFGSVRVCETHAGVLLNATGTARARDVLEVFRAVRQTVYKQTGVVLQNEPELVGFTEEELRDFLILE